MTRQIMSNDHVRLVRDVPELALREGEVGVVRSSWYVPVVAFEVEFGLERRSSRAVARVLLPEEYVESTFALSQ